MRKDPADLETNPAGAAVGAPKINKRAYGTTLLANRVFSFGLEYHML